MEENIRKLTKKELKRAKTVQNSDGWANVVTGMGTPKDKNFYSTIQWERTSRQFAEALYGCDEIAQKIARIVPYDGTREGITWNMDKNADQESIIKYLEEEFLRLQIWKKLGWAWTQSRVYGGALVLMSVEDGRSLDKPLRPERVRRVNNLTVMNRWEFNVRSTEVIDDISSPFFGIPEWYHYNTSEGPGTSGDTIPIHHTRVLRFDGVPLPTRMYKQNEYWHDSIYGALGTAIRNYSTTHDNISIIISDFNQPVFRIEGMSEAIAQDEEELIVKKLQTVNLMRSAARAVVLDKEDEFENVSTNVAGGKELIELTVQRLVAGTDIPHTRLLGNSPSGLGATGEAELINYYDSVKSLQEIALRDPLTMLTELLFKQRGAPPKPEDLAFQFNPLFQQNQEKEIKTREMQANSDEKYINLGVYTPEEVANSRFGTGRYSYETVLEEGIERVLPQPAPTGGTDDLGALNEV
jgi:phage-related protein (TIGR01555 family)